MSQLLVKRRIDATCHIHVDISSLLSRLTSHSWVPTTTTSSSLYGSSNVVTESTVRRCPPQNWLIDRASAYLLVPRIQIAPYAASTESPRRMFKHVVVLDTRSHYVVGDPVPVTPTTTNIFPDVLRYSVVTLPSLELGGVWEPKSKCGTFGAISSSAFLDKGRRFLLSEVV